MRGLAFQSTEPSEEDLEILLHRLRPLTLQNERTSLRRIFDICERHLRDDALREALRDARAKWKRSMRQGPIALQIDDRKWSPEYIADLLINGFYSHDDHRKRAEFQRLLPGMQVLVRHEFVSYLFETTRVALYIANVVRSSLRDGLFR